MNRRALFLCVAFSATVLIVAVCAHAAEPSWIGKTIILKRPGIRIGYSDAKGKQVFVATLSGLDYRVRGEQDGWLSVSSFGVRGWFDKEDAVLLKDAATYFTDIIKKYPDDADAYNRRGWVRKLSGAAGPAIQDFSESLRLAPDAAVFNNRAAAWCDQAKYDRAIQDCNEAVRLDPKYAGAFNARGNARAAKKEYDAALQDYSEAIRLAPKFAGAFYNRSRVWAMKGDQAKAREDLSRAASLDPTLARAASRQSSIAAAVYEQMLDWWADLGDEIADQSRRLGEWVRWARGPGRSAKSGNE